MSCLAYLPPATPTLLRLLLFSERAVNIAELIGVNYLMFGMILLQDYNGAIVKALEKEHHWGAVDINMAIFQKWLDGKGMMPVTWSTLVTALKTLEHGNATLFTDPIIRYCETTHYMLHVSNLTGLADFQNEGSIVSWIHYNMTSFDVPFQYCHEAAQYQISSPLDSILICFLIRDRIKVVQYLLVQKYLRFINHSEVLARVSLTLMTHIDCQYLGTWNNSMMAR